MSKRAERRFHSRRMKKKARLIYLDMEVRFTEPPDYAYAKIWAAKNADNLASCSKHCCGNPRRHCKGKEKLTTQELRYGIV